MDGELLADLGGNIYFVETLPWSPQAPGREHLVSLDADGGLRFNVPVAPNGLVWPHPGMLDDGLVLLTASEELLAFSQGTGALRWKAPLLTMSLPLAVQPRCSNAVSHSGPLTHHVSEAALFDPGPGQLGVVVGLFANIEDGAHTGCHVGAIALWLDSAGGLIRAARIAEAFSGEVLVDANGVGYASAAERLADRPLQYGLVSFAPSGQGRWFRPAREASMQNLLFASTRAVVNTGVTQDQRLRPEVLDPATGAPRAYPELEKRYSDAELRVVGAGQSLFGVGMAKWQVGWLRAPDDGGAAVSTTAIGGFGDAFGDLVLTSRWTTLFSRFGWLEGEEHEVLTEISPEGRVLYQCLIRGGSRSPGAAVLVGGRYVRVRDNIVEAFPALGRAPAPSGMVTRGANAQRTGRER